MPTPSVPTVTLCIDIDLLFYPLPNFSFGRLHKAQSWKYQFWSWDWMSGNYSTIIVLYLKTSLIPERDSCSEAKVIEIELKINRWSVINAYPTAVRWRARGEKEVGMSLKLTQKIFHLAIWSKKVQRCILWIHDSYSKKIYRKQTSTYTRCPKKLERVVRQIIITIIPNFKQL